MSRKVAGFLYQFGADLYGMARSASFSTLTFDLQLAVPVILVLIGTTAIVVGVIAISRGQHVLVGQKIERVEGVQAHLFFPARTSDQDKTLLKGDGKGGSGN